MRAATPGPRWQGNFNFAGYNPNVSIPSVADCYSCHDAMACSAVKSAVLIPAVRKGLCNQRVRMVQDVMLAHLFGAAAGTKCPLLPQWPGSLLAPLCGQGCGSCAPDGYLGSSLLPGGGCVGHCEPSHCCWGNLAASKASDSTALTILRCRGSPAGGYLLSAELQLWEGVRTRIQVHGRGAVRERLRHRKHLASARRSRDLCPIRRSCGRTVWGPIFSLCCGRTARQPCPSSAGGGLRAARCRSVGQR